MNYNTTAWENLSGLDSLIAINQTASYLPVTLLVVLLVLVVWTLTRNVSESAEASFMASLVFAMLSIPFAVIHLMSYHVAGIALVLAVITGVMMVHKNKPNSL